MDNPTNYISIISAIVSILGAIAALYGVLYKLKPEKQKINSEATSSISDAAESVATGARVTVEMLSNAVKDLERKIHDERIVSKKEIADLNREIREEREARLILESALVIEKQARIRAEKKITVMQRYIEDLLEQMKKANITPSNPIVFEDD